MFLCILDGTPEQWARYGRAYGEAWTHAGHASDAAEIAVAVHGFVWTSAACRTPPSLKASSCSA